MKGTVDFYWTHALMPDEIYHGVTSSCNFASLNSSDEVCLEFIDQGDAAAGNIYSYDIYAPLCNSSSKFNTVCTIFFFFTRINYLMQHIYSFFFFFLSMLIPLLTGNSKQVSTFDPCSENYIETYLNIPRVQEALHANVTGLPYPWQSCRHCPIYQL